MLRTSRHRILLFAWVWLILLLPSALRAQLVVDAFPAWDGQSVGNRWMPVVVEISNKGAPLQGLIEVAGSGPLAEHSALCAVEIPSQTNKRLWIYVPPAAYRGELKVRLLTPRGKVLAETPLKIETHPLPSRLVAESIPTGWFKMGLGRVATGKTRLQWNSTRVLKQHLPDDEVGYDGLTALHLGWPEISDLLPSQRQALLDWILSGGHLIVSADDPNAWRADPWWGSILPVAAAEQKSVPGLAPLQTWLDGNRVTALVAEGKEKTVTAATAEQPIAEVETLLGIGELVRGHVLIEREGIPLVARTRMGRGMVTQLLFNPGREPFRSWQGRSDFCLHLLQDGRENMDAALLDLGSTTNSVRQVVRQQTRGRPAPQAMNYNQTRYIQPSAVESFASNLLLTRQQRTLPWLLLGVVLIAYIILIGPFDYTWLKRRRKLIWTWVTFPAYVVAATLIIYGLGYWVNAGDSEWRQWTILDWFPGTSRQRATTMAEFYSTRNSRYHWSDATGLASHVRVMDASYSGRLERPDAADILVTPSGTEVSAAVPVWTSRGFLGRFSQPAPALQAGYNPGEGTLTITNPTQSPWRNCRWMTEPGKYRAMGNLGPGETKTWKLDANALVDVGPNADALLNMYYNRGYGEDQRTECTEDQMMNGSLGLFFLPSRNASAQIGSVGEGLDLSEGWQEGDAVFVAMSDAPANWPWQLAFNPRRTAHRVMHRIYFASETPPAKKELSP